MRRLTAIQYRESDSWLSWWLEETGAGRLPDLFGNGREQMRQQADAEKDELYKQIGQLKVELDFLKKRAGLIT